MPLVAWILPALGAVLAAWVVQNKRGPPVTPSDVQHKYVYKHKYKHKYEYAIYVIGDLHGDAACAEHWVKKTGLIEYDEYDTDGGTGRWTDPTSHLVFVGDYVDKGPTSRQVVELVKGLTERFSSHVTALLGNHEMELLLDRDRGRWDMWGGAGFFGLSYASAHPGEYLNYIDREPTAEDEAVVEALYKASVEVYGHGMHKEMHMAPSALVGNDKSILRFVPADMRNLVEKRLEEYQQAYLDAYRSGTELGTWLEDRPILAQLNETIFVHGGISQHGKALIEKFGVDGINVLFRENSKDKQLGAFIETTREGQIIYDLLTFRGNHQDGACQYLPQLLPEGVSRLGVGHTPSNSVRLECGDTFLALDSSLGRWFRNSGNEYCPGHEQVTSSNSRYVCKEINELCEGQIVKLTAREVEIIE